MVRLRHHHTSQVRALSVRSLYQSADYQLASQSPSPDSHLAQLAAQLVQYALISNQSLHLSYQYVTTMILSRCSGQRYDNLEGMYHKIDSSSFNLLLHYTSCWTFSNIIKYQRYKEFFSKKRMYYQRINLSPGDAQHYSIVVQIMSFQDEPSFSQYSQKHTSAINHDADEAWSLEIYCCANFLYACTAFLTLCHQSSLFVLWCETGMLSGLKPYESMMVNIFQSLYKQNYSSGIRSLTSANILFLTYQSKLETPAICPIPFAFSAPPTRASCSSFFDFIVPWKSHKYFARLLWYD